MVRKDFTYNEVSYIGYETISLYRKVGDNPNIIQFWAYKSEDDVDTIYINVSSQSDLISEILSLGVTELVGE